MKFIRWLLVVAVGCGGEKATESTGAEGAAKRAHFPFPSMHMMVDGHVSLPADLPIADGGTPVQADRLAWREGFSVVQSAVIDVDVAIDMESLPPQSAPQTDGSIQLWDLTAGVPVLTFAELDAAEPVPGEFPSIIVRPQNPLTPGHQVAVVVTGQVMTTSGEPLETIPWYRDVVSDRPGPGLGDWVAHYQDLQAQLERLGLKDIRLAFDFPIADGGQPVRHVMSKVAIPSAYTINEVRSTDDGIFMPEGGWKQLRGTYTTTNWLIDDLRTVLDDEGLPMMQGSIEADLRIYIPESVRDAEPGTVPVWIFGHGLFGRPDMYLGDIDDPSKGAKLADEAGVIVFATVWRGFEASDKSTPSTSRMTLVASTRSLSG